MVLDALVQRYGDDTDRVERVLLAWRRVSTLDSSIVSQSFIDARDRTAELLGRVSETTEQAAVQQETLATMATNLAASSQEAAASSQELAAVSNDMVQRVAEADEAMVASRTAVGQGGDSVAETTTHVEHLGVAIGDVRERGRQVEELLTRVTDLVGSIESIADQTNLLALNAAIEAARAGEAGRGFAVVADEVRKLAGATRESLEQILELSNGATSAVTQMHESIGQAEEAVGSTAEGAKQTRAAFEEIDGAAARTAEAMQVLGSGVKDVASASTELASFADDIAGSAETMTRVTNEMSETVAQSRELLAGAMKGDDRSPARPVLGAVS